MYLSEYAWQQLYDELYAADPALATKFASYFGDLTNGYYQFTGDLQDYTDWLSLIFDSTNPKDWQQFISWDPNMTGNSGQQGGGFKILP